LLTFKGCVCLEAFLKNEDNLNHGRATSRGWECTRKYQSCLACLNLNLLSTTIKSSRNLKKHISEFTNLPIYTCSCPLGRRRENHLHIYLRSLVLRVISLALQGFKIQLKTIYCYILKACAWNPLRLWRTKIA
jgi:hypothetical protein